MNNLTNINCEEFELLIDGYLDGELLPDEKDKLEKHLTTCKGCTEYMNDTAKLIEKTAFLPKEAELGKEKKDELWQKIQKTISSNGHNGKDVVANLQVQRSFFSKYRYMFAAVTAVVILAALIVTISRFSGNQQITGNKITTDVSVAAFWKVANAKGNPQINDGPLNSIDSVGIGQWITTNDTSSIDLFVSNIGKVTIEPKSKVMLVKSAAGDNRIQVQYGTIDASIDAKARSFFVEMPSVTAVDLGCSYKLTVDSIGNGLVYVTEGKVSLESTGRETIVPEGKFCITKKDIGPGTPFRGDAAPQLKQALIDFDFGNCAGTCVNTILKNAKKTDAVTLVSILPRVEENMKKAVYAKVAGFVAPPKSFSYDTIHIPQFNNENLEEWIEKIQEEVHSNIEKSMEQLKDNMEKMSQDMDANSKEWEEYGKQWQKFGEEYGKQFEKNFDKNFKRTPRPKGDEEGNDTAYFDKEEFKRSMEEMKQNMEEMKNEFDKEQFKKEMQQSKEEMKRANIELKEAMKEMKKNMKIEFEKNMDSTGHHRMRIRINGKDNDVDYDYDYDYDNDNDNDNDMDNVIPMVPETPNAPETPETPETKTEPTNKVAPNVHVKPVITPETPESKPEDDK